MIFFKKSRNEIGEILKDIFKKMKVYFELFLQAADAGEENGVALIKCKNVFTKQRQGLKHLIASTMIHMGCFLSEMGKYNQGSGWHNYHHNVSVGTNWKRLE